MIDSNYDINANTKAYWKLNETSGNFLDSSGNNNTGTPTNITYSTAGKFGNCASFNGSSSYISVPDSATLDTQLQNFTFNVWINTTYTGTATKIILIKQNSTGSNAYTFIMGNGANGRVQFGLYDGSDKYANTDSFSGKVNDGNWHMLTATGDGTRVRLYLDSVEAASYGTQTAVAWTMPNTDLPFEIGRRTRDGGLYYFDGKLDEIIVESVNWTQSQIFNYFSKSQTRYLGEYLGAGSGITRGLYHLNGNSNDSSGNGNNGTDTNVSYVSGLLGLGASFAGTGRINLGNPASLQLSTTATIVASFKSSGAGASFRGILVKPNAYGIFMIDNVLGLYDRGAGQIRSTGINVADSKRHNCVVVYDSGVTNGTKVFLDGNLVLTTTTTVAGQLNVVMIGSGSSADNTQAYSGLIDECIINSDKWADSQVRKYYTYTKGRFGIL